MTIKPELLETLRQKRQHLLQTTTPEKLEALHAKGALSARERLMTLFDQDTFQDKWKPYERIRSSDQLHNSYFFLSY